MVSRVVKNSFKGGLNLQFLEQPEFEPLESGSPEQDALIIARNALRFLMMGWSSSWTELLSWSVFKAVFIQRDPNLLKALRFTFQQGFEHLFKQLHRLQLNEEQKEQVQLYLSNCLSLLPYSDLTPYESIKIPQLINNHWEFIEYYVTPIELTSPKDIIKDFDRVFAYGLQPIIHPNAQSHLLFMGTTYPAGQGFVPQIETDFKAFDRVGNTLYQSGRQRIVQWLAQQKNKIHVCGVSLGGALSLLFALDQGEYIERVDALNPPGLADIRDKNEERHWDNLITKPKVVVQRQANDPVSIFGTWKEEWEIVHVAPPKDKRGPNPFCDHFLNYAGFAETEFSYVAAEEENVKRKYRNFLIFSLGRGFVYYGAIWPYSFLFRPSVYFLYEYLDKKSILLSSGVALGVLVLLSCLSVAPLYLFVGALIAGLLSYGFMTLCKKMNNQDAKESKSGIATIHDPKLPRNPELDVYNPDNAIDVEFTQGQMNTYYSVMRSLVKQKEVIPTVDKPYKHNQELTKRELLLASQNPANWNKNIKMCMSKAKIINIKRVLDLEQKIGMNNKEELKEAVENEYLHYCLGK